MMIKEAEEPFVLILSVRRRSLSKECVLGSLLNALPPSPQKPPAVSLGANQEPPFVNQGKLDLATVDCALNSPQSHSYFNHTGPAINHQAVLCDCDEYSVTCRGLAPDPSSPLVLIIRRSAAPAVERRLFALLAQTSFNSH